MSGDDSLNLVRLVGCLVLVGGALAARRLPLRQTARMAFAWAAIFAAGFLIFAFKDELVAKLNPESGQVAGGTLRVPMADDGHFWVRGTVNGVSARFLVDSGATTTALADTLARDAGVADDGDFGMALNTANGPVIARRVRIERLAVGPIVRAAWPAVSAPEFGGTNVLGMDFLSSLRSWGVEGRTLVLRP